MHQLRTRTLTTLALLLLGVALPSHDAVGQHKTLQEQLVGTWTYVTVDNIRPDGSRVQTFGPHPQGLVIFDGSGRYAVVLARAGLPKYASNNRLQGTPEENQAVVQGSIAHFGRYTVNEAEKTITFHIETSTFPNWNGTEQKRPAALTEDELKWTVPASAASGGGSAEVVLQRTK